MAKFNLTTTLSKTVDEIGRFYTRGRIIDPSSHWLVLCVKCKDGIKRDRQDELPEANNARRVWMRFSVIYHKLNWSKRLIWSIFFMFTVSEGNTVKRMEDIFWKPEKNLIYAFTTVKNIFFTRKIKGKIFGFLLNLQTPDIFGSLQKTFEIIWNCREKTKAGKSLIE